MSNFVLVPNTRFSILYIVITTMMERLVEARLSAIPAQLDGCLTAPHREGHDLSRVEKGAELVTAFSR
jgi:hypothetical protein